MKRTVFIATPLGRTRITGDEQGVTEISCQDELSVDESIDRETDAFVSEPVRLAVSQLEEYFAGTRQTFDFLMNPAGTPFQQRVWQALREVPYGKSLSYLTLSRQLGDEKAIRAVAAANGRNPLWIVVPCHRIVGSDGALTGYAGGLWRKKWLLEHEGVLVPSAQLSLF